ncbi:hypothetical protein SAMN05428975_3024 [Mucilaginibacter sp. OK268]|uniref:hypothetical protein n=1 Tax=Mucilaginibacter sp. OK268 TaxID=1881048 RepID=UPI0008877F00|nr:hypothetical protein [Mucilaginibacter sp. OK268]SDP85287.1 hypothetical protein SAMN05428975_3024 [Mucilaginibacter sp. OK268]
MKKQILLLSTVIVLLFIVSCKDNHESLKTEDEKKLRELYADIQKMAQQFNCENAVDWKFTDIGSKACGGATGFIAYSIKLDTAVFLQKVRSYTTQQAGFNKKWGVVSDCSLAIPPKSVTCDSGKPKFTY